MKPAYSLIFALAITGCALFQPYSESTVVADPAVCAALPAAAKDTCRLAADSLTKGYATLAGYNGQIARKKTAGIYTKAQAQALLDKSVAARKDLDKARAVFLQGDYAKALSQTKLLDLALGALEKELAKEAAK
jgi:hypothetical protein